MGCLKSKVDADKSVEQPTLNSIKTNKQLKCIEKRTRNFKYCKEINLTVTKPSIKNIESLRTIETDRNQTKILHPLRHEEINQIHEQHENYQEIVESKVINYTVNKQMNNAITQTQIEDDKYSITIPQKNKKQQRIEQSKKYEFYRQSIIRLDQGQEQSQDLHSTAQRIDITQLINEQIQNQIVDRSSISNSQNTQNQNTKTSNNKEEDIEGIKYPKGRRSSHEVEDVVITMKKTYSKDMGIEYSTVNVIVDDAQLIKLEINQKTDQQINNNITIQIL